MHGYLADFNERFPPSFIDTSSFGSVYAMAGRKGESHPTYQYMTADKRPLNRYLGGPFNSNAEVPIAHCPSDQWFPSYPSTYVATGSSYTFNTRGALKGINNGNENGGNYPGGTEAERQIALSGTKLGNIRDASLFVMASDVGAWLFAWNAAAITFEDWHGNNSYNLLFVDGHVKFQKMISVAGLDTNTGEYEFQRP